MRGLAKMEEMLKEYDQEPTHRLKIMKIHYESQKERSYLISKYTSSIAVALSVILSLLLANISEKYGVGWYLTSIYSLLIFPIIITIVHEVRRRKAVIHQLAIETVLSCREENIDIT